MKKHIYVLIRTDLSLPQQMVQSIHAAYEAASLRSDTAQTPHLVLCSTPNEKGLLKASYDLKKRGIEYSMFQEPDIGNQITSLCTEPIAQDDRFHFSNWKLWKE